MNLTTGVSLAGGVVVLVGALWATFNTLATKTEVEAVKIHVLDEQRDVAGALSKGHLLDRLDTQQDILLLEIKYLERREASEGRDALTPSERRELDALRAKLRAYEEKEETVQREIMESS